MNTQELMALVQARFGPPNYAMITEVANGTGAGAFRRCDGLAMSLWPSRGLALEGMELKASRSDWREELKTPAKAESIFGFCDRWWLVTAPGVAKADEIPGPWG